jgi:hypothetical protein
MTPKAASLRLETSTSVIDGGGCTESGDFSWLKKIFSHELN